MLVTGAEGFIGSHLTSMLLDRSSPVRALVQYNSFNSVGWLASLQGRPGLEIMQGDIRDPYQCREMLKDIDIVYNLAALIAIPYSYRAPESYLETNAKGTLNICSAALEKGGTRVVHVSTSEVYGTARYVPIDENHPRQPQSPYSASKIAADALALSFFHAFQLPVIVARPFNTYGPRQSARAVIPTIIVQMLKGVRRIKLGDVTPTRDFNYVTDTCRGLIALGGCNEAHGREVNIATGTEISISDVFYLIRDIMNNDTEMETDNRRMRPQSSEVYRLLGDNSLITSLTGYKPEVDIREGLRMTCDWFSEPGNMKYYEADGYII